MQLLKCAKKMCYAITGKTAAELNADRANATKENMGLTNWKGSKASKTIEVVGGTMPVDLPTPKQSVQQIEKRD